MRSQQSIRALRTLGLLVASVVFTIFAGAGIRAGGLPPASAALSPPDGAQLFRTYCAACHGTTATGGGPAATAMKVPPPDLTKIAMRNKGMFPAERVRQIVLGKGVAAHGDRNMPVWGDIFARRIPETDPGALVDALIRYLVGLQERPA